MIHAFSSFIMPSFSSVLVFGLLVNGFVDMLHTGQPQPSIDDYFEVHRLDACWQDGNVWIIFDRDIHQPVPIVASVRLMQAQGAGWGQVGEAFRPARTYSPQARLPDPEPGDPSGIDLDWWAWGEIPLPSQTVRHAIWTDWAPEIRGLNPIKFQTEIQETCEGLT